MIIPVRLYRKASGEICETLTPGESGQLLVAQGQSLLDQEAKRLGITEYLQQRGRPAVVTKAIEKAVAQWRLKIKRSYRRRSKTRG